MNNKLKFETKAVRTQVKRSEQREHSVPIYATSSFIFDDAEDARAKFADERDGNLYSRYSNPNNDEFVEKMCLLEGAEDGISTASGMAAIFTCLISFLRSGDHVLACRNLFGSTHQILTNLMPRWNIEHTYVDIDNIDTWKSAVKPNTKILLVETPTNPGLDLLDLEKLVQFKKDYNLLLIVDNCFATPYIQNPIEYGADIVCHSATKFIDGQGRTLGGVVLGSKKLIAEVRTLARQTGPSMSPFNGWILSKSLETLSVRMEKHCENALKLAEFLSNHAKVNYVKYPFLKSHKQYDLAKKQMKLGGGIVCFEPKGEREAAIKFINNLKMLSISSNLGDTRTIVTHPPTTTHSKLTVEERNAVGITEGMLRISVGLEHIDDIIVDIDQALNSI